MNIKYDNPILIFTDTHVVLIVENCVKIHNLIVICDEVIQVGTIL